MLCFWSNEIFSGITGKTEFPEYLCLPNFKRFVHPIGQKPAAAGEPLTTALSEAKNKALTEKDQSQEMEKYLEFSCARRYP